MATGPNDVSFQGKTGSSHPTTVRIHQHHVLSSQYRTCEPMRTTPRRSELSATTLARSISCVRKWATRGKSIALELAREFRRLASSYITVMGGNTISGLLLRLVLLITFLCPR